MPLLEVGALGSHFELRGVIVLIPLGDRRQAPAEAGVVVPGESVGGVAPCDLHKVPAVHLAGAVELWFIIIFYHGS